MISIGIRRKYLRSGRSWSLYLSLRRVIKHTVIITQGVPGEM